MTGNTATFFGHSGMATGRPRRWISGLLVLALTLAGPLALTGWADEMQKGKAAAEKGDWRAAADAYGLVLDKKPGDRLAALALTEAAIKANATDYYPVIEDALLALRERNGRDYEVLVALGQACLAIAATKSDTLALKSYNDEALKSFEAAARIKPKEEAAAVGIARVHYESAFFEKAVQVVDEFLARKPASAARALYWKGQALYTLAGDMYQKAGSLTDEVKATYKRAQGAYEASAAADPTSYDTQIQLAYASAWVGDRDGALAGYRKAAELDPTSVYPFKGFESLFAHSADALTAFFEDFVKAHPEHPQGLWYLGYNRLAAKDWPKAIEYLKRAAAVHPSPGRCWYYLGKAYEGAGKGAEAEAAYWKALEANPDDVMAAWALELIIQKSDPMARARQSVSEARAVMAEYDKILEKAPNNYQARNNIGFTLREAYVAHAKDPAWLPILEASTKYYVEASAIIGEFTAAKAALPYPTRHGMAQVISDTGLMFQFYPHTKDWDKAVDYYNRALEYSEDGYWDAYNNLRQILIAEERWDELYDLSLACAEGIKQENGSPDQRMRGSAKATAEKLVRDGKVSD